VTVTGSNVRNNAEFGVERAAGFFDSGNVAVQGCFFAGNGDRPVSEGVDQSGTRASPVPDAGASL
jgi:hypothetical protein